MANSKTQAIQLLLSKTSRCHGFVSELIKLNKIDFVCIVLQLPQVCSLQIYM